MKIKVEFGTGEIEVSGEIEELVLQFSKDDQREAWRTKKRKGKSFDELISLGKQFAASDDTEMEYIKQVEKEQLHNAIAKLRPDEQELLQRIFFDDITMEEYAKKIGVDGSRIRHRKKAILEKLKNLLK